MECPVLYLKTGIGERKESQNCFFFFFSEKIYLIIIRKIRLDFIFTIRIFFCIIIEKINI